MAFLYWITDDETEDPASYGYIGITSKTVDKRLYRHRYDFERYVKTGKSSCVKLYNKVRHLGGWSKVTCKTLCESTVEHCLFLEQRLRSSENIGWNIKIGGPIPGMLDKKSSEKTKEKLRQVRSKWELSEESRLKMSLDRMGVNNPMSGTLPWLNPSSNELSIFTWKHSDVIYDKWLESNKCGVRVLFKNFADLNYWTIDSMIRKFKLGWIPRSDANWLILKEQNDKS